tara:strand:+ start:92 stop:328 length:237 start_codon:yes stop_codon:yes gene_type:complete
MNKLSSYKNILIGSRVHWYEYSSDMIIVNGGRGLVIDIFSIDTPSLDPVIMFTVLKDCTLELKKFSYFDIDPVDEMEW